MRTIKFRGKSIYGKREWIYGCILQFKHQFYIVPDVEKIDLKIYRVIPETVGQFTGLTDKNGKEIYEGDLVSFDDDPIDQVCYDSTFAGFVFVRNKKEINEEFYLDWLALKESHQKYYIIHGNIHDNPELVKQP